MLYFIDLQRVMQKLRMSEIKKLRSITQRKMSILMNYLSK